MAIQQASTLEQLSAELSAAGVEFLLFSPLPDSVAQVQFIGRFQGQAVVWNLRLFTLERYTQERGSLPTEMGLRGLMHIAPSAEQVFELEVALDVAQVDESTIKKTMLMIQNYRQLRLGLRTWGEAA